MWVLSIFSYKFIATFVVIGYTTFRFGVIDMIDVGDLIKQRRKKKGLTQIELASKAGISVNSLRLYEAGKRQPKVDQLVKIASALDTDIFSLLSYDKFNLLYFIHQANSEISSRLKKDYPSNSALYDDLMKEDVFFPELRGKTDRQLIDAYSSLNEKGREKAVERVEELTEIPKYQKKVEPDND